MTICVALLYDMIVEYANICRCVWFVVTAPFHVFSWSHLAASGFCAFQWLTGSRT
ncbi:hypothetical protein BS47DRAFT_1343394 [Hydnum rufescens UP504]|uniref:Uncharacterized protein n=1 Tax=Hydnum rufescens UP504 TaxID=1448309 RepID=A0A9P6AYP8_9AGAM|nr:hypothetical protein BS47DRAFT_1343394 [Hydnum rufescens UP504]